MVGATRAAEAQLYVYSINQNTIRAIGLATGLPVTVYTGLVGGQKASLAQRTSKHFLNTVGIRSHIQCVRDAIELIVL